MEVSNEVEPIFRDSCSGLQRTVPFGSMVEAMKPAPTPNVPGNTEFEKFDNFFRAVIAVPKVVIDKEESKWKRKRAKKKRVRKPT